MRMRMRERESFFTEIMLVCKSQRITPTRRSPLNMIWKYLEEQIIFRDFNLDISNRRNVKVTHVYAINSDGYYI